jgi:hypothetical protein
MSLVTPEKIRTLQRKLYRKAKAEPAFRFYVLYDKICREDILRHAYLLPSPNPILITDLANFSVCKIDLKHVFRRPDHAERGMCAGIKDLGSVGTVLVGRNITVIASYIEGQPVRSVAASQGQSFLYTGTIGLRISQM